MKRISKKCSIGGCPAVYDIEDGSGDVLVVGKSCGLLALDSGVFVDAGEHAVRISRSLIEEALGIEAEKESD